jgi:hypothetical protein
MTTLNINEFKRSDFPNSKHEKILKQGKNCACLSCLSVFPVVEITDWLNEGGPDNRTAWCPKCYVDNVIPEIDGITFDNETLKVLFGVFNKEIDLLVEQMMSGK